MRNRLLSIARMLVEELERDDWRAARVRELLTDLSNILYLENE